MLLLYGFNLCACWNLALTDFVVGVLIVCSCRETDWKYAAEKFVRELPDKVFVHCKAL